MGGVGVEHAVAVTVAVLLQLWGVGGNHHGSGLDPDLQRLSLKHSDLLPEVPEDLRSTDTVKSQRSCGSWRRTVQR